MLRKVGEAIARYRMIRDGDRVAVALSGGKDSLTLLEAFFSSKNAPQSGFFRLRLHLIEQGKFLAPFEPLGHYLKDRGIDWTYFEDGPSFQLLDDEPEHGCDKCSRYRRRAVYEVVRGLNANVIAFGHTADDFCEAFLRNAMYTGRCQSLPPVTYSAKKDFLLDPSAGVRERGDHDAVCGLDGLPGNPLRLFTAHRDCPQVDPVDVQGNRAGPSISMQETPVDGDGET